MAKKQKNVNAKQAAEAAALVKHVVNAIEEKKGGDLVCINLKKIPNSVCDYFVICEGNSNTHVQAIAGSVEELVKKHTGNRPWHIEGMQNGEWVLMDYVNVAVHIFQPEARIHYNLENMWADAEVTKIQDGVAVKQLTAAKRVSSRPVKKKSKSKPVKKASAKKPAKKKISRKK